MPKLAVLSSNSTSNRNLTLNLKSSSSSSFGSGASGASAALRAVAPRWRAQHRCNRVPTNAARVDWRDASALTHSSSSSSSSNGKERRRLWAQRPPLSVACLAAEGSEVETAAAPATPAFTAIDRTVEALELEVRWVFWDWGWGERESKARSAVQYLCG